MRSTTVYYAFLFLFRFGLGATISLYTPFLRETGLSYGQISLVNAAYWFFTMFAEIPTGMLADGRGRGWSVIVGAALFGLGGLLYAFAQGFVHAVFAEIVLAVGAAFMSGALDAWVMDAPDRTAARHEVLANAATVRGVANIFGTLFAAYLARDYGSAVIFLILGFSSLVALLLAVGWMQGKEPESHLDERKALTKALAYLRLSPAMRWAAALEFSYGIYQAFNMFWALLLLSRLTEPKIGYLWIAMQSALVAAGMWVRKHSVWHHGSGLGIAYALALCAVPLMCMVLTDATAWWIVLILVHEIGRGAFAPVIDAFVHERIDSDCRATFGSVKSFCGGAGMLVTLLLLSVVMAPFDNEPMAIPWLWFGTGLVSLASTALLWRFRPRAEVAEQVKMEA